MCYPIVSKRIKDVSFPKNHVSLQLSHFCDLSPAQKRGFWNRPASGKPIGDHLPKETMHFPHEYFFTPGYARNSSVVSHFNGVVSACCCELLGVPIKIDRYPSLRRNWIAQLAWYWTRFSSMNLISPISIDIGEIPIPKINWPPSFFLHSYVPFTPFTHFG